MEATDAAKDLLMEKGFDAVFGARPMRRAIQNLIEDPLAEGLLHGRFQPGDIVLVDRSGEDLTLETKPGVAEVAEKVAVETPTPA
jgi:ATP-dependent Clp protease ATP-binding subunit ClpA